MQRRLLLGGLLVLLMIGGVAASVYFSRPSTVNLEAVQQQIDAGDYSAAARALEQYVARNKNDAEAYFLLGLTYFNTGKYTEARAAFQQAMTLDPDRAGAVHHNLGALAYQTGELETATQEFNAALAIDPNDPDSHYQLGATYLVMAVPLTVDAAPDADVLSKAEVEFQHALQLAPEKPEALVGLGNVYLLQNRFEEAVTVLAQAVKARPQMSEALFALGRAYAATEQPELARTTLQQFLDTQPPAEWAQQAQLLIAQLTP